MIPLAREFLFIFYNLLSPSICLVVVISFTTTINVIYFLQEKLNDGSNISNRSFDYIIIGGGTAGSIIAARISESSNYSVLLLEAGIRNPDVFSIPILGPMLHGTSADWQYVTVPQNNACLAMEEQRSRWPAGKLLGGTAHLNFMMYVPGHIEDYDTWPDGTSDDWSASDVRYYFSKSITGSHKLLPLKDTSYYTALSEAILLGAEELGVQSRTNFDLSSNAGFSRPLLTMEEGGRRWTADKYLEKVQAQHSNLVILSGALVTQIVFDEEKQTTGVKIVVNEKTLIVFNEKEIILSAGTMGSPHLLMLSGIGPKPVLEASNITTIVDLPVGQNLQDHVTTGLDLLLLREEIFNLIDLLSPISVLKYFFNGDGPYTTTLSEVVGLLPDASNGPPSMEIIALMAGLSTDYGEYNRHMVGIKPEVWNSYFAPLVSQPVATILPVLLHPKSIGWIKLNETYPSEAPIINPNYLAAEEDVEALVDGLYWIYNLTTTKPMVDKGFMMNRQVFPGCSNYKFGERDYFRCYVRHLTLTSYHPVGTCRMGLASDASTVVDHKLRVHGIKNLRVVDASIMPNLPSGNPIASVIMIAEKAADMIKSTWTT